MRGIGPCIDSFLGRILNFWPSILWKENWDKLETLLESQGCKRKMFKKEKVADQSIIHRCDVYTYNLEMPLTSIPRTNGLLLFAFSPKILACTAQGGCYCLPLQSAIVCRKQARISMQLARSLRLVLLYHRAELQEKRPRIERP